MSNPLKYVSLILIVMMVTSTLAALHAYGARLDSWPGYVKPGFPDYAPSGMPDFDEKQPQFTTDIGHVQYSWCVPVAVANSLWWLDSKFESKNYSSPVPPPTISDHFSLVTAYGAWDDHDPQNVFGLVPELAMDMHTDGLGVGGGYVGTKYADIQPGINTYLANHNMTGLFEVHGMDYPAVPAGFSWIDQQVQACQDVELCLEFWYFNAGNWIPATNPIFELGHCVTCAGIDNVTNQVLVSDPYYNAFEAGLVPGRSPVPHIDLLTSDHNNASLVSQDAYMAVPFPMMPPPPGYPPFPLELQNYLQINGFSGDPNWHAFIRGAVATSPTGVDDVALTNLTCAKTVVGQGFSGNLTATVQNLGNFTETINVTAYANTTTIVSQNITLASGTSANMTLVWAVPTNFTKGNYTLSAYAWPVPDETNTSNNNFTDHWIIVAIACDITSITGWPDGRVDMKDIAITARCFGSTLSSGNWNANVDFNNDGKIDMKDIALIARHFGNTDP
jgi:hypothetical protein